MHVKVEMGAYRAWEEPQVWAEIQLGNSKNVVMIGVTEIARMQVRGNLTP